MGSSRRWPPPLGKNDELVAEAAGAVDVVGIARVDPEVQAIAVFEPIFAAPRGLRFSGYGGGEQQALIVPRDFDGNAVRGVVEFGEVGQQIFVAEGRYRATTKASSRTAGGGKAKEEARGEELLADMGSADGIESVFSLLADKWLLIRNRGRSSSLR